MARWGLSIGETDLSGGDNGAWPQRTDEEAPRAGDGDPQLSPLAPFPGNPGERDVREKDLGRIELEEEELRVPDYGGDTVQAARSMRHGWSLCVAIRWRHAVRIQAAAVRGPPRPRVGSRREPSEAACFAPPRLSAARPLPIESWKLRPSSRVCMLAAAGCRWASEVADWCGTGSAFCGERDVPEQPDARGLVSPHVRV